MFRVVSNGMYELHVWRWKQSDDKSIELVRVTRTIQDKYVSVIFKFQTYRALLVKQFIWIRSDGDFVFIIDAPELESIPCYCFPVEAAE